MLRSSNSLSEGLNYEHFIREILDSFYFAISISSELNFEVYRKIKKIQRVIESHPWWQEYYEYYGISLSTRKYLSYSMLLYNSCNMLAINPINIESCIRNLKIRLDDMNSYIDSLELNEIIPHEISTELHKARTILYSLYTPFICKGRVSF